MSETVNAPVVNTADNVTTEAKAEVVQSNPFDVISEDLRKLPSIQKFKDLDSLAKSYVEIEGKLGKRIEDLSAEDLRKLSGKFGAPAKPEDYGVDLKSVFDVEGLEIKAHELGVPVDALKGLTEFAKAKKEESLKVLEADLKAKSEELKKAFPDFDVKQKNIEKVLLELGNKEVADKLSALGQDKDVFQFLSSIGELLNEDRPLGNGNTVMTKSDIESEINKLYSDKDFMTAFKNATHPAHQEANNRIDSLYKKKWRLA